MSQLELVAANLERRKLAVVEHWRSLVLADAAVSTSDSLSRAQFVDHVPAIIDSLAMALREESIEDRAATIEHAQSGAGHGMHRWQQGYSQIELVREWGHLHLALIDELRHQAEADTLDSRTIHVAYRTISRFCTEATSESAERYERMQRTEAAGQVKDLARALAQARALEQQQAEVLRGVAHDLRGNLGVVANATEALKLDGISPERQRELVAMVQRALKSHTALLTDLMDLARLRAGQEHRTTALVDVTPVLREICELAGPVATAHGLMLEVDGPESFHVEVDRTKLSRVVQNLLLNALHYTIRGGVSVRWGDSRDNDPRRWMISIEDTGPGLNQGPTEPLRDALQVATEEVLEVEDDRPLDQAQQSVAPDRGTDDGAHGRHRGEGIGLSIVKRLCELLDSSLEIESSTSGGTVIRVVLPRQYRTDVVDATRAGSHSA